MADELVFRQWVFQKEITQKKEPPATPEEKPFPEGTAIPINVAREFCGLHSTGEHVRDNIQSDVSLFRFSGLTFNAHKIHYSQDWCRNVEGHRNLVVHGPFGLIGMLDLFRDTNASSNPEYVPKTMSYRAQSPLYVDEKYRVILNRDEGEGKWKTEIYDSFGKVASKGTIVE